ncbi:MAG TPA: TolC family protein [Chryseosolibacter sp.]
MKKVLTLFAFLVLMLIYMGAAAQTYSLEECINLALQNNQQLKNSQLEISAADYRIKEVKSALMPTIDVVGQLQYYRDLPSQYAPASAFGGPEGEYRKLTMAMAQTTNASVQMSQTLYSQSVRTGIKAAKAYRETSELQESLVRENLVYNVTATYFRVQVLNDNLSRLADNIENFKKTTTIDSVLKDNELVSANVHNRMLIGLENLKNQYENQKLALDQNITQLKVLMDMDMNEKLEVNKFEYADVFESPAQTDIDERADILLQKSQVQLAQLDKKNIAAGYFPTLSNRFNYGYTGYYDEFAPHKQINNDWIASSSMTLTLKIPVFDGFQKQNQLRQKEVALQKNTNTLAMMKANANKEVEDATRNYFANKNLTVNSLKSLELAEKVFSSAQSEYENGITSATELLNAQNDLSNARNNYSTALLNMKLAELSLKKANGTLLTSK